MRRHQVWRRPATLLLAAACAVAVASPAARAEQAASSSAPADEALVAAEAAFRAGRFAEARDLAARVGDRDPGAGRARFVEGYARFKLGELAQAAEALRRALALDASPAVRFLSGLVAFERERWDEALALLRPVATSGQPPWAAPASQLVGRAERRIAERRTADHARAVALVREHVKAGRLAAAAAALAEAERLSPGHPLNHYYRGYLAYEGGDRVRARLEFDAALARDPDDPLARYMLALSLDDEPRALALLSQLASRGGDPAVRDAAAVALRARRPSRLRGLSLQVEVGVGTDTNPASVDALAVASTSLGAPGPGTGAPPEGGSPPPGTGSVPTTATAGRSWSPLLRAKAELAYRRELAPAHTGTAGLRFVEQSYTVADGSLDGTEVAGWLEYALRPSRRPEELAVGYSYGLHLLGYAPLMSLHEATARVGRTLGSRLRLALGAGVLWRDVHDRSYQAWQSLESSGSLTLTARWRPITVQVGYQVVRRWASPTVTALGGAPGGPGAADLTMDLTALGHGPRLRAWVSLPWRLSLDAAASLVLDSFDHPATVSPPGSTQPTWEHRRFDVRVVATAELRRPLGRGLEAAVQFNSVDNVSSLDASTPVSQSYARRQLLGVLRWRWAPR